MREKTGQRGPYQGHFAATLEYLPSDYTTDPHLTLTVGRRLTPFNMYSEQKLREKLDYMHADPVKRGLVSSPEEWLWSSFRFYYLNDSSVLRMDRLE